MAEQSEIVGEELYKGIARTCLLEVLQTPIDKDGNLSLGSVQVLGLSLKERGKFCRNLVSFRQSLATDGFLSLAPRRL
ncbi:hypothetical protein ACFLZP_02255 [Patescibacteria group bacterium]